MNVFDVALALTPRIGGQTAAHIIDNIFSAEALFALSAEQICQKTEINRAVAENIAKRVAMEDAVREIEFAKQHNIDIIASTDPEYPALLRDIVDPPHVIFAQGNTKILSQNLVAIVGTRKLTSYGEKACFKIIEELASKIHNIVIVSGLAYGIDATAHRAALHFGIPTVAIVPSTLPEITPASHRNLANEIIEAGGTLISEMPHTRPNNGKAFISRNRIIAGASAATIVIESRDKGGSMHTANIASSYGRVVGAVPGRITDSSSEGCNKLITQRIATPITNAEDLIRELAWGDRRIEGRQPKSNEENNNIFNSLTAEQQDIIRLFTDNEPLHVAEIERRSKRPIAELTATLLELELLDAVKMRPGSLYEAIIKADDQE